MADCAWDKDTEFPAPYPPLLFSVAAERTVLPVLDGANRVVK
jgi:hypothetical protein